MTETKKPIKVKRIYINEDEGKPSQTDPSLDDIQAGDTVYTRDAPSDGITKTRKVEIPEKGYYTVCRFNPYGHWRIVSHSSGRALPERLQQTYTSLEEASLSIYRYEGMAR